MENLRGTFAEIDLAALEGNFKAVVNGLAPGTFVCPMIKADAYGHGAVEAAKALTRAGAKHLGVCLVEEGLELRAAGVTNDVLVFLDADRKGARELVNAKLTPVVTSMSGFDHLQAEAKSPIDIHVKFDTGMNRLGFSAKDAGAVFDRVKSGPFRLKGLATHLLNGQDADTEDGTAARQLRALNEVAGVFSSLNPEVHALNSAGIIRKITGSKIAALGLRNWGARPGLMIYGAESWPNSAPFLKPAMTLKSKVQVYHSLKKGETVSYNGTWKAQRDSTIAVIPVGYGDGYHRILSNKSHVLYAGKRAPVVGTICMDYLMIDVTDIVAGSAPKQNRDVILFGAAGTGEDVNVMELADKAQTVSWEMLTSIGRRVPRVYKGGG